jgi:rSAM/selenodomain-associated transferase 2
MISISIVVPVLNEEGILLPFLERLARLQHIEIIVVDGGSEDRTLSLLRNFSSHSSFQVLTAPRGRARQMNEGAKRASGESLLFLHADSTLSQTGLDALSRVMSESDRVGGAFRLRIDSTSFFLKAVSWAANARSQYLGLPYGDQGIFVRRSVFEKVGGYADLPLMEDVDFIRRLKKVGPIVLLNEVIVTSSRRWNRDGRLYNSFRNFILLACYLMGISPFRLARWYHR